MRHDVALWFARGRMGGGGRVAVMVQNYMYNAIITFCYFYIIYYTYNRCPIRGA